MHRQGFGDRCVEEWIKSIWSDKLFVTLNILLWLYIVEALSWLIVTNQKLEDQANGP